MPRFRPAYVFTYWSIFFILINTLAGSILVKAQEATRTVRLDGDALVTLTGEDPTLISERVRKIERRLILLLERPELIVPSRIEAAGPEGKDRAISVDSVTVMTVTVEDAQDQMMGVDELAKNWSQRIDSGLEMAKARRMSPSSRFVTEVRGSIEAAFKRLGEAGVRIVPRLLAAIIVLIIVWLTAALVRAAMRLLFRIVVDDLTIENLIKQTAYYFVWFLGFIIAADALGFEAETVITGLGLTSLALGFALKDIISNFVSGLLLLLLRPFRLNDQIVIGQIEGNVVKIELRATQIRSYDGRINIVPNQELFTSRVINNTASPIRRGQVRVFVGFDSDMQHLLSVMQTALLATDGVLQEPQPTVRIGDLGASDIEVEALFWTDSRRSDFVATSASVRQSLLKTLQEEGFSLPDPALRVIKQAKIESLDCSASTGSI